MQWYAQRALRNAVERVGGESGTVIVADTASGELLALADYPTYDSNDPLGTAASDDDLGSRAVSEPYEPGSVEKALTFAALLDQELITPAPGSRCPPSWSEQGPSRSVTTGTTTRSA
ncbi:penicillin-binding transpeptidase domain-containing protein [Nocardioides alcanivorans]|uniref:penicillin-binding transpeptidase domain-containing protein n=1 Tax=Nocardioides alcanivorans TaxID=2897352 RepID=UPI001F260EC4|nr:penicillin-binding transpeptidase domain-containing protein [Nocardioides alcanivorans]